MLPKKQSGGLDEAWDVASPEKPARYAGMSCPSVTGLGAGGKSMPKQRSLAVFARGSPKSSLPAADLSSPDVFHQPQTCPGSGLMRTCKLHACPQGWCTPVRPISSQSDGDQFQAGAIGHTSDARSTVLHGIRSRTVDVHYCHNHSCIVLPGMTHVQPHRATVRGG